MSNFEISSHQDIDSYVDIDELLEKYHKSKSKFFFLICAVACIFLGTVGGFYSIQASNEKIAVVGESTIEFARIAASSEYCQVHKENTACQKAILAIEEPEKVLNPAVSSTVGPNSPAEQVEKVVNTDPVALLFAVLTQQPIILRIQ